LTKTTTPEVDEHMTVDHLVLEVIRVAAEKRAQNEARELSKVAWAIVERAAKNSQPTSDGVAHPARRPTNLETKRIRFSAPRARYQAAKERIRDSGRSVAAVLEEGLERYARTGNF
jgi:hypothetical protein